MRMPSRQMPTRFRLLGPIALIMLAGCSGTIGEPSDTIGGGASGPGATSSGTRAGTSSGSSGPTGGPANCTDGNVHPNRAPLRRITRFEYTNTVRELLTDPTPTGSQLPSEEIGNGFSNSADHQSASSSLIADYGTVAEAAAARAVATPAVMARYAPCAASVTAATQDACARTMIEKFAPLAYRRPLAAGEADELLALQKSVTAKSTFVTGIASVIEAVLQSPDFLYRVEFGVDDPARAGVRRPSGDEMATRLSYLFWGTSPDDTLRAAAQRGELLTNDGVRKQAERLVADGKAHEVSAFFFDNLLPINALSELERDKTHFPTFSKTIGSLLRVETQTFLENEIFGNNASWPSMITANYTYVNGPLAAYYGIPGVQGDTFVKVPLPDTKKRLGLLLQGGIMAGTITTNESNPVLRGSFVINKILCQNILLPTDPAILAQVKVPEGVTGKTARERFSKHSEQAVCKACHQSLDPIGFALENFDPVGLWRDTENQVMIDASGGVPGTEGTVNGPVELVQKLATTDDVKTCFATHWADFAYGRITGEGDECTKASIDESFKKSGYNVKQMLVDLTQTDAFLYLPAK